ncbi:MAG TPA: 3-methyl-2-oxobutanoate hydroxymethyltransferase [Acidobacteriota bacterium]|nr:3-methyl-2-oxobutanoate hydroxymethyltransferase [Acidobacteriota bacterium]
MRVTTRNLRDMKKRGEKIAMITAYDFPMARMVDSAGVDVILVGDSLGMVVLGYDSTIPVTMEDMLHHAKAVVRGSERAMVVVDMPFMSYQVSAEEALRNAGRLIQEGGAQAVKLEGGEEVAETVARIVRAGIPVMGHVGLTPQSVHQLGGFRVVGKSKKTAQRLLAGAAALEQAGVFSTVLESVPAPLARKITELSKVPTIGIGAGVHCDGQVQVFHDIFGAFTEFLPKHAKRYLNLSETIGEAMSSYVREVKKGEFPTESESFGMNEKILADLDS